jgi:hypothetical protein
MACNIKEDSIEHILSFMGDVFKITIKYLEVYVKLHIIQMIKEHVIHIDHTWYIFSKLKYGYENCNPVIVHVGLNNVFTLSLHMGNGSIENQSFFPYKEIIGSLQFAQLWHFICSRTWSQVHQKPTNATYCSVEMHHEVFGGHYFDEDYIQW